MWFRRRTSRHAGRRDGRRAHKPFDESTLPKQKFLTVAEAVDEGLLLTEYASRMSVKNSFLKGVLGGRQNWDLERGRDAARATLQHLSAESDADGDTLDKVIAKLRENPGSAPDAQGYSADDLPNMEHRREVSRNVAQRLREQTSDEPFLNELVSKARRDAWREVAANIEHNLDIGLVVQDADYSRHREKRMRLLVVEDLAALAAESAMRNDSTGPEAP